MPRKASDTEESMKNSELTASLALMSAGSEDHMIILQVMILDDEMRTRQHEREQEAAETEIRKITSENERLKLQMSEEVRHREQEHKKEMMKLKMEDDKIKLFKQREQERQCREEDATRSLQNAGLVAAGVAITSGAIGGALGAAAAAGLAAGVAVAAATVLAPVTGTVAILSGAGYVYKKAKSSNRA